MTVVAGFIRSHLAETLLGLGQTVTGLDNFATGHSHNLDAVQARVCMARCANFRFIEGDIRTPAGCHAACV